MIREYIVTTENSESLEESKVLRFTAMRDGACYGRGRFIIRWSTRATTSPF